MIKLPKNDRRPFTLLLIPAQGESQRDRSGWANAEDAADYGCKQARAAFPGMSVEVIVLEILSNEAIISTMVMA